jgi:hypothetical protein
MVHEGRAFELTGTFAANGTNKAVIALNPPAAKAAVATVVMTDTAANLIYTFNTTGTRGNEWSVTHLNPSGNSKPLTIQVAGTKILISLATNGSGTITSTAAQVAAAVNASDAAEFMTCTLASTGGTVNDVVEQDLITGASDVYIHFQVAEFTAAAEVVVLRILENATYTGTAATFTPICKNRVQANTSTAAVTGTLAATVTTTSAVTLATLTARGSATNQSTTISGRSSGEEFIFNPGKAYVLELSPAGATAIDYHLFWYEEESA